MKISIITVCFNSAETIEKTIKSIISQTYDNIEYLVIDGGSKDSTLDILDKYKTNIDYMISEPDKGLYDAMNKGIGIATGDLIGILNSDDTFFNENVITDVAKFHLENNIDASIGNIIQHNEEGKTKRIYSAKNWLPEKLKIGFMPPHPSIFFNRGLFNRYAAYKLDYKIGADYELITRFFLKHKIVWAYSGITTTSMLIGGVSSSGFESYKKITVEIQKALKDNGVNHSSFKIKARFVWKLKELI